MPSVLARLRSDSLGRFYPGPSLHRFGAAGHSSLGPPDPSLGQVSATLDLLNGSLIRGNFLATNGISPIALAVDPTNGGLYVASEQTENVTVVDGATDQIIGTIPVGQYPSAITYDPANGFLYVANLLSDNLTVINGATNTVVTSIPVGEAPDSIAYDPTNGDLYVGNLLWDNLTVVDGATDRVIGSLALGGFSSVISAVVFAGSVGDLFVAEEVCPNCIGPRPGYVEVVNPATRVVENNRTVGDVPSALAWDETDGEIYVANSNSNNVSVIDGSTDLTLASIGVGNHPSGLAWDVSSDRVYVSNEYSDNLSVIDGASHTLAGSIPAGIVPIGMASDAATGRLLVANQFSDNLTVVDESTETTVTSIVLGIVPSDIVYDSSNGNLYTANFNAGNVSVISAGSDRVLGSIPAGFGPYALAYDPSNGFIYVANLFGNITVINGATESVVGTILTPEDAYPEAVSFDGANGDIYAVYSNMDLVVVISGATDTIVRSIPVGGSPTDVSWDSANGDLYVANAGSNNISVIDGATNAVVGTISLGSPYFPDVLAYDSANGYVYVASSAQNGPTNYVTAIDGATDRIVTSLPVDSYVDGIGVDPTTGYVYVVQGGLGEVTIIDGLADRLLGSLVVGQNPSGVASDSSNGEVYVANFGSGSVSTLDPTAPTATYTVTFSESGLPPSRSWTVEFGGAVENSTSSSIAFSVPNGSYQYLIVGPSGHRVEIPDPNGTISVAGADIVQSVHLGRGSTHALVFREWGLPRGRLWCASLGSWQRCTTKATQKFSNLTPAHYTYEIPPMSGQSIAPKVDGRTLPTWAGLNVTNQRVTVEVVYSYLYTVTFRESGLPSVGGWSITVDGMTKVNQSGDPIVFDLKNGTYPYRVVSFVGYRGVGSPRLVRVGGAAREIAITFRAPPRTASPMGAEGVAARPREVTVTAAFASTSCHPPKSRCPFHTFDRVRTGEPFRNGPTGATSKSLHRSR